MECGTEIRALDIFNATAVRFIAQCHGRFLLISASSTDYRNGYLLPDWRGVLRELVAMAVPAKLIEKQMRAEGIGADHLYTGFPLTYPLPVAELGRLLHAEPGDVRAQLEDLAVSTE